ncbi:MAG TPA: acyltransferase family protein [Solirubrobacteraceae bacterium]|nr:acyltransferase family protein [Solirubrobacteraceae bacterium]
MPGLDGVRAFAVFAVIAYHLGFGWAPGGLLGVGVFFTLSGYLITDLLLDSWNRGRWHLRDFWLRRARRLLPALFVMLAVVSIWVAIADPSRLDDLRGEVISSALYVNNWWQISQHVSYFARFSAPSPLNHLWSLAVEEQFYLLWPWLLLLGLRLVRERGRPLPVRPRLAGLTLVLAAASAVEMGLLYHPGFDSTRIYEGTDTRAFGLLIGAALAMVWPSRSLTTQLTAGARRILDTAGVIGLVSIAVLVWRENGYSGFLYPYGIILLSLATAAVVAVAAHPATRVGRALGWGPLRWLGVRSYAIYLWHEPIIVLTTPASSQGPDLARAAAQVAASIAIAALSWRYVEDPIRHGALGRFWSRLRSSGWRAWRLPLPARVAVAGGLLAVVLAGLGLAGVRSPVSSSSSAPTVEAQLAASEPVAPTRSGATQARSRSAPAGAAVPNADSRTSCRSVVHFGDSTSAGLVSSDYLPDPAQRMGAQYARVGVRHSILDITPATSIVETPTGTTDAYDLARKLRQRGYQGCWVIALGTNDAADVYVGSSVGYAARINRMMSVIGDEPVMWVNVKSLVAGGPYAESNMRAWDAALIKACARYPNMRVFDWAAVAKDSWFIPDGIHYYSPGYAARAQLIADALGEAFPARGSSTSRCLVQTKSVSVPVLDVPR